MALGIRQEIVRGGCPLCGGTVVLRWSRATKNCQGLDTGFAQARCRPCGGRWFVGSYADCPVEELGTPERAIARLREVAGCAVA